MTDQLERTREAIAMLEADVERLGQLERAKRAKVGTFDRLPPVASDLEALVRRAATETWAFAEYNLIRQEFALAANRAELAQLMEEPYGETAASSKR